MTTNRYPGITDEHAAAIVARQPYEGGQSRGYIREKDGAYIIGTSNIASDSGEGYDLLEITEAGAVLPLRITANPEPIERILADAAAEAPTTFHHSRKGAIRGWVTRHDGTWVDIRLAGDHELRYMSTYADPHHDDGETITVRAVFLNPVPTPEDVRA
ncbi:hypothetical protein QDA02_gp41 [Microbacterium phage Margaery]|uniref:Uncharacterized protein n=1 Tax=Microbacterium phage Margaery TaxID=2591217 RepID=A0A514DHP9_9CAUD|nr:hypothetical protein QDA02_gp41 [Microbacterium phage Margaery]QDH93124.1 hypothetical protein PBI_MARGAERY_67 [Microbacterium phage Margaery]